MNIFLLSPRYEVYGELSEKKDNAILLFHALSASQHTELTKMWILKVEWDKECQTGWWDELLTRKSFRH